MNILGTSYKYRNNTLQKRINIENILSEENESKKSFFLSFFLCLFVCLFLPLYLYLYLYLLPHCIISYVETLKSRQNKQKIEITIIFELFK